eukprot:6422005-Ditylum_brightwellii.AAC.1
MDVFLGKVACIVEMAVLVFFNCSEYNHSYKRGVQYNNMSKNAMNGHLSGAGGMHSGDGGTGVVGGANYT